MLKIKLNKGQNLYITSDTHAYHANICRGTSVWGDDDLTRDFDTIEEMNEELVDNINHFVKEGDILIHLGDWSFGGFDKIEKFRSQLNVKDIRLVLGNHDHHILNNKDNIRSIFTEVYDGILNVEVRIPQEDGRVKKQVFVMCHYPIASWMNMDRGWIHLYGHCHNRSENKIGPGKMLDVGVDGNDLKPWLINNIMDLMDGQPIKSMMLNDHHIKS